MAKEVVNENYGYSISPDIESSGWATVQTTEKKSAHCKAEGSKILVDKITFAFTAISPYKITSETSVDVSSSAQNVKCDGDPPLLKNDYGTIETFVVVQTTTSGDVSVYSGPLVVTIDTPGQSSVKAN